MNPSRESRSKKRLPALLAALLLATALLAQQTKPAPPPNPDQNLPEAPSAVKPPQQFPPATVPPSVPPANPEPAGPPPAPDIRQVPEGGATPSAGGGRDQLFTLVKQVNFVVVPVTVKDTSGRLVEGLTQKDFRVKEDDAEQKITFFTSDPFPLSAAVVIDLGMPEVTLRKVKDTLSALVGAFGQFDEVGVYTYGNTVAKQQDYTAVNDRLSAAMKKVKGMSGEMGGVPVVGGPFGSGGPSVNGRPLDPGAPTMPTMRRESHVLNDAILAAALDLSHRDPTRRKVLFVISDGQELGSTASYSEVLKVLLSYQISVYGIGVGSAAIPGYGSAQRIHLPGFGTGNILPKYASATGGQVFAEFSSSAIEQAYSRVTGEARNQYTIGYTTRATPSSAYRSIEVLIDRPGLNVFAKAGYYPLPPGR